jgi:hypothetical protein
MPMGAVSPLIFFHLIFNSQISSRINLKYQHSYSHFPYLPLNPLPTPQSGNWHTYIINGFLTAPLLIFQEIRRLVFAMRLKKNSLEVLPDLPKESRGP